MKSFSRITLMLVVLAVTVLSATAPSWADEPTQAQPEAPIEAQADIKIFLPIIIKTQLTLVNGNFESGNTGWTVSSTHSFIVIRQSFAPNNVPMHGGSWGAWLGGDDNETTSLQQQVSIPASAPYLAFWHWIGSGDACGYDKATLSVNGAVVHQYDLCYLTSTSGWVKKVVNLSAYAGQAVTLRLQTQNDSSANSNLFVDDVAFQASAAITSDDIAGTVVNPTNGMGTETGENEYNLPQP